MHLDQEERELANMTENTNGNDNTNENNPIKTDTKKETPEFSIMKERMNHTVYLPKKDESLSLFTIFDDSEYELFISEELFDQYKHPEGPQFKHSKEVIIYFLKELIKEDQFSKEEVLLIMEESKIGAERKGEFFWQRLLPPKKHKFYHAVANSIQRKKKDKKNAKEETERKHIQEILATKNPEELILKELDKIIRGAEIVKRAYLYSAVAINHRIEIPMIAIGAAGAGKSSIAKLIAGLFEDHLVVAQMSDKALYYNGEQWDKHIVVWDDPSEENTNRMLSTLKAMRADGQGTRANATVVDFRAQTVEATGNTTFWFTSVNPIGDDQVRDGFFTVPLPDTKEYESKRIKKIRSSRMSRWAFNQIKDHSTNLSKILLEQICLHYEDTVFIPYEFMIKVENIEKYNRTFGFFIDFIEASALLHKFQRKRNKKGHIIANGEDFLHALEIFQYAQNVNMSDYKVSDRELQVLEKLPDYEEFHRWNEEYRLAITNVNTEKEFDIKKWLANNPPPGSTGSQVTQNFPELSKGYIYRILNSMEKNQLIISHLDEINRNAKRYYRYSEKAKSYLPEETPINPENSSIYDKLRLSTCLLSEYTTLVDNFYRENRCDFSNEEQLTSFVSSLSTKIQEVLKKDDSEYQDYQLQLDLVFNEEDHDPFYWLTYYLLDAVDKFNFDSNSDQQEPPKDEPSPPAMSTKLSTAEETRYTTQVKSSEFQGGYWTGLQHRILDYLKEHETLSQRRLLYLLNNKHGFGHDSKKELLMIIDQMKQEEIIEEPKPLTYNLSKKIFNQITASLDEFQFNARQEQITLLNILKQLSTINKDIKLVDIITHAKQKGLSEEDVDSLLFDLGYDGKFERVNDSVYNLVEDDNIISKKRNKREILFTIIRKFGDGSEYGVELQLIISHALEEEISEEDTRALIEILLQGGEIYDPMKNDHYKVMEG